MSNLEKLLEGVEVEWKTLGEVASINRGRRLIKKQLEKIGKYAVYQNCMIPLGYHHESNVEADTTFIICAGSAGEIGYSDVAFWAADDVYYFITKDDLQNKFLYYFLLTQQQKIYGQVRRSSVPRLSKTAFEKLQIPIPCPNNPEKSLEIQKEIVCVLDKFSTLIVEITTEITAELQARKSQYEYYRNQLLTYPMEESNQPSPRSSRSATSIQNNDNSTQPLSASNLHTGNSVLQPRDKVEWKMLREVVLPTSNIRWKNTNKSYRYIDLTSVCRDNNTIIETIEINKENAPSRAQKLVLKNDVIFATTRPTQQRLCLIPEEYDGEVASTGYCVLRANMDLVLPKWIYFWITSNKFKNYVEENQSGSAYPAISDAKVKEFKIPIPYPNDIEKSFEEQKRIITILDKFDTLTTSITEGLPKEIELRQKQYEYYRDMLLSFPKNNIKA